MTKVNLVYGTVYGSAQFVAETLESKLIELGHETTLWQPEQLDGFIPPESELLLLISSTTGQGDLPDSIVPWFESIRFLAPYLPNLRYGVIGLGDSSYDTFCGAAKQLDELFTEFGAKAICQRLEIDACENMEPEQHALNWLDNLSKELMC